MIFLPPIIACNVKNSKVIFCSLSPRDSILGKGVLVKLMDKLIFSQLPLNNNMRLEDCNIKSFFNNDLNNDVRESFRKTLGTDNSYQTVG